MELLSSLNEIHIANSVINAIERFNITTKNSSDMPSIKRQLKKECDIIYFNIISSKSLTYHI
jgi:RNase P/RNase MRP subunit p30